MAWHIKKTFRFPLGIRINLSESGVGASVGVRGIRVGVDSKGRAYRALSIPGTGLYERAYTKPTSTPVAPVQSNAGELLARLWKWAQK